MHVDIRVKRTGKQLASVLSRLTCDVSRRYICPLSFKMNLFMEFDWKEITRKNSQSMAKNEKAENLNIDELHWLSNFRHLKTGK